MRGFKVLSSPPVIEPLGLQETKDHLRIDVEDDDALVSGLMQAARRYVEQAWNRALIQVSLQSSYDRFPGFSAGYAGLGLGAGYDNYERAGWNVQPYPDFLCFRLTRPPLKSVLGITYVDPTGAQQTLDPTTYVVDVNTEPGRVAPAYGRMWPPHRVQPGGVVVSYQAGYGPSPSDVPVTVRLALKMLVGHWYENREACLANQLSPPPLAVEALLQANWCGEYE